MHIKDYISFKLYSNMHTKLINYIVNYVVKTLNITFKLSL